MNSGETQAGDGRARVAIIGAGFGGIAAAVALQKAGIPDVVIFEKSAGVGGTWWDNRYPGAATDAASHIYSFSFAPRDWKRTHVGHAELRAYFDSVVDEFGLRPKLRLNTGVTDLAWDAAQNVWRLTTESGDHHLFTAVISAVGMFGKPNWPNWPGLDSFAGPVLHTARWDESVDLRGKRVAVVGTGSSAAQVVPALADEVAQLTLFQRQPGWLLPKSDRDFSERERALLKNGLLRKLYRLKLYLAQEIREWNGAFFRPENKQNGKASRPCLSRRGVRRPAGPEGGADARLSLHGKAPPDQQRFLSRPAQAERQAGAPRRGLLHAHRAGGYGGRAPRGRRHRAVHRL